MAQFQFPTPFTPDPAILRDSLAQFHQRQQTQFEQGEAIETLVLERSQWMDQLLTLLWQHLGFDQYPRLCLVAVGGYGRCELHPLSDIDLLLLSEQSLPKSAEEPISQLLTCLWDLKLEVGHSVRTIDACYDAGETDLSIATNLQEARLICGDDAPLHQLKLQIHNERFWPSERFFAAKVEEQRSRHRRYNDTSYNLEPDIKASPGGLRDIHTLAWVARRHFGATSLYEMSRFGFLTDAEYRELLECQNTLWRIRFALHLQLKRYDNRLTFAHQTTVATLLGYQGEGNEPVERMMKDFYRTCSRVSELNRMLLHFFDQAIVHENEAQTEIIDDDFCRRGHRIEARKPALFQARPCTILDMFLHIAASDQITGITAMTIRQLRTARRRLNHFLVEIPEAREKFMQLLRHPNVLHGALGVMHRYGVLSAYLPQWSRIVGQMQFDLFHIYTVDEHSVRLLKQLRTFADEKNREQHPICCEIFPRMVKKELLYIAAIFHDIGKGQSGDHSDIGAREVHAFCLQHGLSKHEANLVSWLVQNHLLMSVTAQRRDIYDPEVIREFAKQVRDELRLDYLVCLTVADICATNSNLWNSWKRSLLAELYYSTQKALRRGLENPPDIRERIRHNQQLAMAALHQSGFETQQVEQLWQRFKADYFLRHTYQQIAWHSEHLLKNPNQSPLVLVSQQAIRGGTEIFVYHQDKPRLFATIAALLERKNLSIHDAQVMISKDGFALDTFVVLEPDGQPLSDDRHERIVHALIQTLNTNRAPQSPRRAPRQLQHFQVRTQVDFLPAKDRKRTMMELVALDMPGLLARVGTVLADFEFNLHAAKITTIGERAEDFFSLTNGENQPLSESEQLQLKDALIAAIDSAAQ
ncbi:Bifunctional uridylyltransferase/uridylyl-removing enzyme [Vibrio stylophorae]|uniref:Bifunctional uridylyltransferase/uridylyl-removing enzyme n=1 Tax=Vibrio stylophorae TaxID=659351 RepID=A0ABN8DWJ5_9VIBR|nr:bifunctional uridylyltransferase/uridylyl-removing protein GlnD [Vibrio stylophorae]CAH0534238.1 Bifunctional uridylyltransferase/uridylyl-removing enzyme [Vibrio stylophorae]